MKFLFIFLILASCAHPLKKHSTGLSILQLSTTESTTEFNVLLKKGVTARFVVITPSGETLEPSESQISQKDYSDRVMHHVRYSNLTKLEGDYQFVVEGNGSILDRRIFHLFSNTGEKLKFIVGSCADVRVSEEQSKTWKSIESQKPEWIFLIGDNVYAVQGEGEITSEEKLWERYVETRESIDLYRFKTLIPVQAIWDDNDYGQKDGGTTYSLKKESQEIFKSFFMPFYPNDNLITGPGVSSRLALRGMHFSFLDDRSFRDSGKLDGTHFGEEQMNWLFDDFQKAQLPTWIISGDQFFGGYHKFDSFEGNHPQDFEKFIKRLKEIQTPFVFISGDRHLTEVMQFPRALLGQLSFEITTSPLHGKLYSGRGNIDPNPWRVISRDDSLNFMLIEAELKDSSWDIDLKSFNQNNELLFNRVFSLTTEALKDFTIEKRQRRRRYRRARFRRR
ncbi:MAG: hypothetical protein K2P81_07195 [Bacteriovoracaceae bacterium]|nr:hypothetical protein [Bacteriovoracaceae bacterium]